VKSAAKCARQYRYGIENMFTVHHVVSIVSTHNPEKKLTK